MLHVFNILENGFVQVFSASSDDYKSPGYFELKASDVMIWEVPNETPLNRFNTSSSFQYRTNNGFLTQYGGNLYNLYKVHFPITSGVYIWPSDNGPIIPVVFDKGTAQQAEQHFVLKSLAPFRFHS